MALLVVQGKALAEVETGIMDRAAAEVRAMVKVGTEAKDRATAEVLVATNARVAVKVSSDNYYYLPATVKSYGY